MNTAKRAVDDEGLLQPHTPQCKKVKPEDNRMDIIHELIKSKNKETVSIFSELLCIDDGYEEGAEDEEEDEEAQPTFNMLEDAKQLGESLRMLNDVGDEPANRLREDLLWALNEDPEDEFDQKTVVTKGKCTAAQAEHFIEEWRAMHEQRQQHEQEEAEEEGE